MRIVALICTFVLLLSVGPARAQEPEFERIGTISDIMIDMVYPLSDEFFYIMRSPPTNDVEWGALRRSALTLAESGNLLLMPGRAIPQQEWTDAAKRLIAVSTLAYEATKAQDLQAILDLSPELEASCRSCHEEYHPRYGRRRRTDQN